MGTNMNDAVGQTNRTFQSCLYIGINVCPSLDFNEPHLAHLNPIHKGLKTRV